MKIRTYLSILAVVLIVAGYYVYSHWDSWQRNSFTILSSTPASGTRNVGSSAIQWRNVDETAYGFQVDLPSTPVETTTQATNERGAHEAVKMLLAHADANTDYAIAWEDNPPVARVHGDQVEAIFDAARTQAIDATYTAQLSEQRNSDQGFPARQFVAKNAQGGYLDARFIWAAPRLYMLIATFPSEKARKEADISRFFQSFKVVRAKASAGQ